MPYIKPTDRPRFDTMIDGLVSKTRGYDRIEMALVVTGLVTHALTPEPWSPDVKLPVEGIIRDLARRIRVRGDANYCVCRIVLEGMKPETGWSYHSLSDTVSVLDVALNFVFDIQRESSLSDVDVMDAVSVLNDAAVEIERRLLGPYEDTAILKNGDMACFDEPFAYKPPSLDPVCERVCDPCRCVRDPCQCEPESTPLHCTLELEGIEGPLPPITEALTQKQYDSIDKERKANDE